MAKYVIHGGRELKGEITPVPNKNSILKLIPAALLTDEDVIIHNVPKSSDVRGMLKIVRQLGGTVSYSDEGSTVKINASSVNTFEIDENLSQKFKSSVMFMGPLLIRFGKAHMPIPGGCKLGTRPLDAFLNNMVELGAKYIREKGYYLEAKKIKGKKMTSWFPSVTGTENLIMMAVLAEGETEIYNAASEPHTQDLCNMLVSMGAKIEGIGSNKIKITGVEKLGGVEWSVISDHLNVSDYIAASAITNSEIRIKNAIPEHMSLILQFYEKIGIKVQIDEDDIIVPKNQKLVIQETARGDIFDMKAGPWPLFPADGIHTALVAALKAKGSFIFYNTFYEYGFFYMEELIKMKANVIMADPTRLITYGPTDFQGATVYAPNIIQATMALVLAGLAAEGTTTVVDRSNSLIRRYPNLVEQLSSIGAKIEKQ